MEFMSRKVREDGVTALEYILEHMAKQKGEGGLVITAHSEDEYTIGYEFGSEAPDSPMAGGAAYGIGSATEALVSVATELGLKI